MDKDILRQSLYYCQTHTLWVCVWIITFSLLSSCQHNEPLDEILQLENDDAKEYWYTRTRSSDQQTTMLRSHAVGFSYDAIYGESCDLGSVRCQVLNLDILKEKDIYSVIGETETKDDYYTAHSLSECFSILANNCKIEGNAFIYQKEAKSYASIFEKRSEDIVLISNTRICQVLRKEILMDDFKYVMKKNKDPYKYLSSSFCYGIEKIKNSDNVAVVDSFIDIFGTHVVTEASVGGRMKLDLVTSIADVKTLNTEKKIESECWNLYFAEESSTNSSDLQKFFEGLLKKAELKLKVKGGDVSAFNKLIADPYSNDHSPEMMKNWIAGLKQETSSSWNSKLELAEMSVNPIWEFIPDQQVAAKVRSRIEATAPTMQELYGNRNFIDVKIPSYVQQVKCKLGGKEKTFKEPYVVDVFAANRHVATLCKEWVPEIDSSNAVVVAYPIYENKIQLNAGVCIHNKLAYNVRWVYNQFSVDTISVGHNPGDPLYLQGGYIHTEPNELVKTYQNSKTAIGYEWPGSIKTDGSLDNTPYYETRKFLGGFFLNTDKIFTNLPNWSENKNEIYNSFYKKYLETSKPYELCGLPEGELKNKLKNRMVRNNDYVYYYNPTELQW